MHVLPQQWRVDLRDASFTQRRHVRQDTPCRHAAGLRAGGNRALSATYCTTFIGDADPFS
ncbi:hypothetical protein CVO74_11820 [Xanthomonas prunicola]|uniref:Uncharacterized protein n=1 Tax=Xanthomonas prunicola TaxID=2053930 RepID=A0A2N3RLT9_9XANT|nr:hypothetical protein XpruCFBP8353_09765 [Xanthomonas prunicola]PKV17749.1 hypothetical protein XpruCFBP8354_09765 [Xanthomonas prunicola]PKV21646.1 hypothetical protein CVO74_11820 [Xanthomonas prunicola]